MFTRNFFEYIRALHVSDVLVSTQTGTYVSTYTTLASADGSTDHYMAGVHIESLGFNTERPAAQSTWRIFQNISFDVGSGTTEADATDTVLEDDKTNSFTATSMNLNLGVTDDGHLNIVISWNGTNNTSEDITITEIGLLKSLYMVSGVNTSPSSAALRKFLIARQILENPVTISAGATGVITVKIDIY